MDKESIEELARESKFIQRKSKLDAVSFLNSLMFSHQQGKDLSLLDICGDLYDQHHLRIRKQSIDERFTPEAVAFIKAVLSRILERQNRLTSKNQILSRFSLQASYATIYTGHGGATHNSASMISIQYEYGLLSGNTMDLRLTTGVRNDQRDAKENTHQICEKDLFLRDLGCATLSYMHQIIKNNAYFLNRLNPQYTTYFVSNPKEKVDFEKCRKKMKRHKLPYLEYKVIVGKKSKIPCRLIIYPVDKSTYDKRIRKIISKPKKLIMLLQDLVFLAQDMFLLEKKKGECSHYEVFMSLT